MGGGGGCVVQPNRGLGAQLLMGVKGQLKPLGKFEIFGLISFKILISITLNHLIQ